MPQRDRHLPRKASKILSDLEQLSQEPGFIYSLCFMIARSLWIHPDELFDNNWLERPNQAELSLLLGLLVKNHIRLGHVPTQEIALNQSTRATSLLNELHLAVSTPAIFDQKREPSDEKQLTELLQEYDSWMQSGQGVVEPIFYGGEGAYEFQYIAMASTKYAADDPWIKAHKGASIGEFIEVANDLNLLLRGRIQLMKHEMTVDEECEALLSAMTFGLDDLPTTSREKLRHFIAAFSSTPGEVNQCFNTLADHNMVLSRPIVSLDDGQYFIPLLSNVPRAIYDSPFYWMIENDEYRDTALDHRGDSNESVTHDMMVPIFGPDNVFRGIKITKGRHDVTDIDVLAVSGNRAVIAQCKSKKLTIDARRGDGTAIRNDFKKAVQDSYDQATKARRALITEGYSLHDANGAPVSLSTQVDEVFILCITGDHYPAVITQANIYLQKGSQDPHPIIFSVFDLDLVSYYLQDRYEFLYYLRQRSDHALHFAADSEISLLGFHLHHKLFPDTRDEITNVDSGYGQLVDANFMAARGDWPTSVASERLFHTWKNEAFNRLLEDIKIAAGRGPRRVPAEDLLFFMYDLAGKGADELIKCVESLTRQTLLDGREHSVRMPMKQRKSGVSFVSLPAPTNATQIQDIERRLEAIIVTHKYMSQAGEWMILASFAGSPDRFDMFGYTKDPWHKIPEMDQWIEKIVGRGIELRPDGRKI